MSEPFTESIIGSWLFTRSSQPTFTPQIIYHYTGDGKCWWEQDYEGERLLSPVEFRFADSTLTLIFFDGAERHFELLVEDDGSVRFPAANGILWWMVRLTSPEPYSRAFVDEHGQLQKLECG